MSYTIAITGKGGTGKTSVAALIIHHLISNGKEPVLAVDADPNATLADALGLQVESTLGAIREEFQESKLNMPPGMTKHAFLELKLNQILIESKGIDLLVMGRQEGPGCYCAVNHILREYLDIITNNYPITVIDNEAGMENLSRRTTRDVNLMIIMSDYSIKGVRTAGRIKSLSEELKLNVDRYLLVINLAPDSGALSDSISESVAETEIQLGAVMPIDETLREFDIEGRSLKELPPKSRALNTIGRLVGDFPLT